MVACSVGAEEQTKEFLVSCFMSLTHSKKPAFLETRYLCFARLRLSTTLSSTRTKKRYIASVVQPTDNSSFRIFFIVDYTVNLTASLKFVLR